MNTVKVKGIVLGEGVPKICVPIVAETKAAIVEEAKSFKDIPVDVVEWRADWFEGITDPDKVIDVLTELVPALAGIPLLFTIRTANEGGCLRDHAGRLFADQQRHCGQRPDRSH